MADGSRIWKKMEKSQAKDDSHLQIPQMIPQCVLLLLLLLSYLTVACISIIKHLALCASIECRRTSTTFVFLFIFLKSQPKYFSFDDDDEHFVIVSIISRTSKGSCVS